MSATLFPPPLVPPAPFTVFAPPPAEAAPLPLIQGGPLADIQRALAARLLAAFPAAQFAHRTMPARVTLEGFRKLTSQLPMIGLGFTGMTPVARTGRRWRGMAQWLVFIVVQNPVFAAQMLGDALGCGLFGALAVATCALQGLPIGTVGTAEIGEGRQVFDEAWQDEQLAMATLAVGVPFDMIDAASLAALDDFTTLGIRWTGLPDLADSVSDIRAEADLP